MIPDAPKKEMFLRLKVCHFKITHNLQFIYDAFILLRNVIASTVAFLHHLKEGSVVASGVWLSAHRGQVQFPQ